MALSKFTQLDEIMLTQLKTAITKLIRSRAVVIDSRQRTILHKDAFGIEPPETKFQGTQPINGQIYFYIEQD